MARLDLTPVHEEPSDHRGEDASRYETDESPRHASPTEDPSAQRHIGTECSTIVIVTLCDASGSSTSRTHVRRAFDFWRSQHGNVDILAVSSVYQES